MHRAIGRALLAAGTLLVTRALPVLGQDEAALEYRVKAAYLVNFIRYVEWPDGALPASGPLRICVFGRAPFGKALHAAAERRSEAGRPIVVEQVRSVQAAAGCAILFVPRTEWQRNAVRADELKAQRSLVVGEGRDFAQQAGTIGFVIADETVRFVVNLEARDRAGLRISSRILALATDLYGHREPAP